MVKLLPKANTPDLYKMNSRLLCVGFCKWKSLICFFCSFHVHSKNNISHRSSSLQPVTPASCPQLKTVKLSGHDSSSAALSLCCHPSVKRTALSRLLDSGTAHNDTHPMKYNRAASPPPPIAATHKVSPAWPSQLYPFVNTNKVDFSLSVQLISHTLPIFYICASDY